MGFYIHLPTQPGYFAIIFRSLQPRQGCTERFAQCLRRAEQARRAAVLVLRPSDEGKTFQLVGDRRSLTEFLREVMDCW
jgi:hypothetical protein